uniref:Uncharacterized protein n=1 Tax=Rhodnius prolixus TaxID=13249 RepID=T1HP90_RHOPR
MAWIDTSCQLVKEGFVKQNNGEKLNNKEQENENYVDSHFQKVPYIESFEEAVSRLICDGSQPESD